VKREIAGASDGVRAVKPPKDARRLQRLIVQRLAVQRAVIDELIATELYIPKLAATAPPLSSAALGLRRDLAAISAGTGAPTVGAKGGTSLDRYATAFGRYGEALAPVSTVLAGLTAPPILRPSLDAQRHALARSSALCATIRRTLLRGS
jgi:hypothetical protein